MEENDMTEFERKMQEVLFKKQFIIKKLNQLIEEYKHLDDEEDRLGSEEFARTGVSTMTLSLDFFLSEEDILKDLVKRTEGKMIKPKKPNKN